MRTTATAKRRVHVVFSQDLIDEIDKLVGKRKRSAFMSEAARRKMISLRQLRALDQAIGAWKDEDHPEWQNGSSEWIRAMRQESESRFQELEKRRDS